MMFVAIAHSGAINSNIPASYNGNNVLALNTGHFQFTIFVINCKGGAQWLSGRVLDWRQRGRGFQPQRRHCVVVLEQDTFILAKYWFNPGIPVPV